MNFTRRSIVVLFFFFSFSLIHSLVVLIFVEDYGGNEFTSYNLLFLPVSQGGISLLNFYLRGTGKASLNFKEVSQYSGVSRFISESTGTSYFGIFLHCM